METKQRENIERIEVISKWLLLRLAHTAESKKDIYLRNAIAKNISLLRSIETLFDHQQFNQAYILFRSLLDRLVYVYYLNDNNLFERFEEWSFIKSYEHRNNAKADERFKRVLDDPLFKSIPKESRRYSELKTKMLHGKSRIPKLYLRIRALIFFISSAMIMLPCIPIQWQVMAISNSIN